MLGAGGEFAFVVLGAATLSGVVPQGAGEILTVAATLTMFAIPALSAAGRRLARGAPEAAALAPPAQPSGEARVLVIGYGRVGLMVADMLDRHQVPWVAAARQARPDMVIVARARDARQAGRLYELGATEAVPETVEASLQLSEALLVDIGVPMGLVIASVHEKRDEIRKALNRPEALGAKMRKARDRIGGGP